MKAHQRILREEKQFDECGLFKYPVVSESDLGKCVIKRIDFKTASKIILEYEWIGTMPLPKSCRFMYGIYFDDVCGGAIVYVHPSTRQFQESYERKAVQLNRGACLPWTPKNTASKLISESLRDLKKQGIEIVIAYCTKEAGEYGTIYQSLSWMYVGETQPSKVYWLDKHWISERTLADKTKWAKKQHDDFKYAFKNLPSKQLEGKFKYVKLLGHKNEQKKIMKLFNYNPLPYPKRKIQ
jgi:hypothetical protein